MPCARGLPVTDVAAVTGFPEMLDGRIKTLHPRVHGGLLADRRLPDHRRQLVEAGIAPFELVVVNLYPFAEAAARPGIALDALVEEIDIGGPSMVRAAAKNHANVAIVTDPARYGQVMEALQRGGGIPLGLRSALAADAFRHTAAYDARIARRAAAAWPRPGSSCPTSPVCPAQRPVSADDHDHAGKGRDASLRGEPAPARGAVPACRRRDVGRPVRLDRAAARGKTCPSTTSSMRRRPTRSTEHSAGRAWRSSSTRTRVAPPSGRRSRGVACSPRSGSGLGVRWCRRADAFG